MLFLIFKWCCLFHLKSINLKNLKLFGVKINGKYKKNIVELVFIKFG